MHKDCRLAHKLKWSFICSPVTSSLNFDISVKKEMHVCLKKVMFLKVTNILKALISYTAGYCQLYWDEGRSRAHLVCEVTQQERLQFRAGTATDTLGSEFIKHVTPNLYVSLTTIVSFECYINFHWLSNFFNLSLFLNICPAYKLYPWKIAHTRIDIK